MHATQALIEAIPLKRMDMRRGTRAELSTSGWSELSNDRKQRDLSYLGLCVIGISLSEALDTLVLVPRRSTHNSNVELRVRTRNLREVGRQRGSYEQR
jgi:hypothetical protein